MSESLVSHLTAVAQDHHDGVFDAQNDVVEQIGGQPAQSLAAYIRENRAYFGAEEPAGHA